MNNVIAINPFEVPQGREDAALAMWEDFATYFRAQPGYVSTKLHKALGSDAKYHLVSISEWDSDESFMNALQNPELGKIAAEAPEDIQSYPGLYQVIRN